MDKIKASIIIPVYNAEYFLKQCLDSIRAQTCVDFEVILIDDGSSDRSGEICEFYAKEDYRFKVFHQENVGVTKTREIGITKATGDYVFWCDADDYVSPYLLEKVLAEFDRTDADIVRFSTQDFTRKKFLVADICSQLSLEETRKEVILGDSNAAVLWNFSAKKSLWIQEQAPFEVARSAEDGYMAIRLHMKATRISGISDVLYYHLIDSPGSISHTFTGKQYMGNFFLWNYRKQLCSQYFPEKVMYCMPRILSNGVKAFCLSLIFNDLIDKEKIEIRTVLSNLPNRFIAGRWRDKFLKWCILNGHFKICRYYAFRKIHKTNVKNGKMLIKQKVNS